MLFEPTQPPVKPDGLQGLPGEILPNATPDSSQKPESTPEAAQARAEARARLRAWNPEPASSPAAPTVSQATRRTVALSADVGTPLDNVLTHLVSAFQIASSLLAGEPLPESPAGAPTTKSKPEYPRVQGRPPIAREGEVYSPDGRGSGGFANLMELSRIIHCSYTGLSTKFHAAAAEQSIDPESHTGFEFTHKGHRVKMFPNYVPKA